MRILAVTNLYPRPGHEAMAPFHRLLFAALTAEHDLTVIAPVPWTAALRRGASRRPYSSWSQNEDGIWVARPRSYHTPGMLTPYYGQMFQASIANTFKRLVKRSRPDVVLASWAHPDGWATARLARRHGLPVVIMVIGSDVLVAGRNPARRARIAEALRSADAVLAVSRDLAGHVAALGVDPNRLHVIHTGVDLRVFHPGDQSLARSRVGIAAGSRVVLFVGNLLYSKGAGAFLEAIGGLRRRGVDGHGYLLGGGRDEARLRAQAHAADLDAHVTFVGRRSHEQLADWYRAADVVALPSQSEGIPNVLREATACGRPFVATAVGGIPEIADPEVDRLVPLGDLEALVSALSEVLGRPNDPAVLRSRIVCPSWEESAARLTGILRIVVNNSLSSAGSRTTGPRLAIDSPP
jgi:glycosyltransferase involved in cell wall biosynthesis